MINQQLHNIEEDRKWWNELRTLEDSPLKFLEKYEEYLEFKVQKTGFCSDRRRVFMRVLKKLKKEKD